jgi:hypothetical protein
VKLVFQLENGEVCSSSTTPTIITTTTSSSGRGYGRQLLTVHDADQNRRDHTSSHSDRQ